MLDQRLTTPWWTLRLAYGLVPIVAGLDKFTNLLTDWTQYISPSLARDAAVPARRRSCTWSGSSRSPPASWC